MRLTFLLLFFCQLGLAESFESVATSIFKNADGVPATVMSSFPDSQSKGYLVLFWAGWCVPCKEELALVVRERAQVSEWNVVAINVDDSAGTVRAQGIQKAIGWPFVNLYDESGLRFFQINSSGELPLALAFDAHGRLLKVIRELKEPEIKGLSQLLQSSSEKGFEISNEFRYVRRQQSGGNSEVGANTLGLRYSVKNWQAGASQNLIRQKRDPHAKWTDFEDEIGPSYLQWQDSAESLTRARLGDDSVEWGKGALFSARAIPGTDINASLLGLHWSQTLGSFSYSIVAGRVRQQLFGLKLDPTVDLTLDVPREDVSGISANQQFEFSRGVTAKITAGYMSYSREVLNSLTSTYLTPYEDQRGHLNLSVSQESWGIDLARTQYSIQNDPALKKSEATQLDAYLRSKNGANYQLGGTYLEKHDAIPRTFTPVLTEYPATPLTIDGLRSWRLSPRAVFGSWMVEPQWIAEQANNPDEYEKQNTFLLQVLNPEKEFKTIALYQKHGSNVLATDTERMAGVLGLRLSQRFFTQLEYKSYAARGRNGNSSSNQSGRSFATQISYKLKELMFSVTRTEQDGYFLTTSGIDDKTLMGYRLSWNRGPLELRLAACQEPGGLICSGGVCAQRPPLNGFSLESKMHWNF